MNFYKSQDGYTLTTEAGEFVTIKITDYITTLKTGRSLAYCEDIRNDSEVITEEAFFEVLTAGGGEVESRMKRIGNLMISNAKKTR